MTKCQLDIYRVLSFTYPNATDMFLASGKAPGQFGSYELCDLLPKSTAHFCFVTIDSVLNITVRDKTTYVPCNNVFGFCDFGLCLPTSCNEENVNAAFNDLLHDHRNSSLVKTTCVTPNVFGWSNIMAIILISFVFVIGITGTLVDEYCKGRLDTWIPFYRKGSEADPKAFVHNDQASLINNNDAHEPMISINEGDQESDSLMADQLSQEEKDKRRRQALEKNLIVRLLRAFSFTSNFERLLVPIPGDFGALNGIRVISMLWVIVGHSMDFIMDAGLSNTAYFTHVVATWTFQTIVNTPYAVDSFFFISGFLLAYFCMKELYEKGRLNLVMYVFHRFWRLLPTYMFLLFMYTNLAPMLSNGPMWQQFRDEIDNGGPYCWTNLLFINNLYPSYEYMCMRWTWFLANDMQFYLVSPIFLYVFYKNKIAGWCLISFVFVMSIVANILVLEYDCEGCGVGFLREGSQDFFNNIYTKPWTRISTYMVGIAAAFLVHSLRDNEAKTKNKFMPIHPIILTGLWILGLFLVLSTIYGSYHGYEWTAKGAKSIMYLSFGRSAFTVGVGIFAVLFCMGYGGIFNTMLSLPFWDPFAKLTYSAYLIHPTVMRVYYWSQDAPITYTNLNFVYLFLAHTTIAYILAVFSYCFVEKPFMNLESIIIPRKH
eukprot:TRINITY_DN9271_c0_g1_i1.p1 TRINITY_DN9271_c0_g1~~TRINITY_DN9271_c0_g1_i1.p1  ORF type:complete len:715 (+),score=281.01 TRINITY_DN9271_c0_g1_i1:179-2146(+)